ncbi:MAG: glycosyltransferase [Bacteroidales bacterium]|nr:glycosyltransferase [Bacteroidales bacterium]
MKKILLVSKFYYTRGGAEVVAINMANDLVKRGYEIGVFTMDYPQNLSPKNFYTASQVDFAGGLKDKIKFAMRTMGYYGIETSFKKALQDFKPDIVHLHNVHSYLSPVVVKIAKQFGCKVVWTLHDYKLACPAYSCLNRGKICEKCFTSKINVIKERCFKENLPASVLAYFEAKKWNVAKLQRYVDYFICPSSFIKRQMLKAGLKEEKLKVVCNFVDPVKLEQLKNVEISDKRDDFYVYVGRLSEEKGVATLLKAAKKLPYKLKLVGGGHLYDGFIAEYGSCENIEFLGHQPAEKVAEILLSAKCLVLPSECYENNPLSVIEALCAGIPIVGANIGGIPELIDAEWGETFESGNIEDMQQAITRVMGTDKYNYKNIACQSQERFSFDTHYKQLKELYK